MLLWYRPRRSWKEPLMSEPTIVLVHGAFADATSVELAIMISQPQAVTDVIVTAARSVASA